MLFNEGYAPLDPMELEIFGSFLNEWGWQRFRFATHDGAPIEICRECFNFLTKSRMCVLDDLLSPPTGQLFENSAARLGEF